MTTGTEEVHGQGHAGHHVAGAQKRLNTTMKPTLWVMRMVSDAAEGVQELKKCMGKGMLGTMWMGMWQETEVAAKVLHELPFLVPDINVMSIMEEEVCSHEPFKDLNLLAVCRRGARVTREGEKKDSGRSRCCMSCLCWRPTSP